MIMTMPTVPGASTDVQAMFQKSKVRTTTGGSTQYLSFGSYNGLWNFGRDKEDVTDEMVVIAAPTFTHGWHLWADKKVDKVTVSFTQDLPEAPAPIRDQKGKLQEPAESRGWQGMLLLEDAAGNSDPAPVAWEHNTDGCRRACDEVLNAIMARAVDEAEFLYPKVRLTSGKPYENPYKDGEMIHPPKLEIVAWCNVDGVEGGEVVTQIAAPADEEPPFDVDEEEEVDTPAAPRRRQRRA